MAILGDALRQGFMSRHEYESLRDEDKAWIKLQRPIFISISAFVMLLIFVSSVISFKIVFPSDPRRRPFCKDLPTNISTTGEDHVDGAFDLSDQEFVDYYRMVVFVPSAILFLLSSVYLVAAYTAPTRHGCLKVVENSYCAPKRGVRCLFILNFIFAITFGLVGIFFGSTLLILGSSCSIPLFWSYEIASWGLVTLYGGTASLLRRKEAMVLDDGNLDDRIIGVEMLEANPVEFSPDMERRVNEGFRTWMGTSYLSSDDEDDEDDPHSSCINSNRQRV